MSTQSILTFSSDDYALSTDLYQLTMAAGYFENRVDHRAIFELFVREMPRNRGYMVFAGLEQVVEYLNELKFTEGQVAYLRSLPQFENVSEEFFEYLLKFKFRGDQDAMPEGTVFFPTEPVLRVEGPAIDAQIVESFILSVVNFQSLIATKASRITSAAKGCPVIEFGLRRSHSPAAGLMGVRGALIGGCLGTSNVLAAQRTGAKPFGTMSHSWVMNFPTEKKSFLAFYKVFPNHSLFLLDTYNVLDSARLVTELEIERVDGVRLDSGNIEDLASDVRRILNKARQKKAKIFATGDLNEHIIESLLKEDAPIDSFGVGTELITSRDDPAMGGIYKLVGIRKNGVCEYKMKLSSEKETLPGPKQVYRVMSGGRYKEDHILEVSEKPKKGAEPLLRPIMKDGRLIEPLPSMNDAVTRHHETLKDFPSSIKDLRKPAHYPVKISSHLEYLSKVSVEQL
ncbi:nicotinate phosphoribosyltransferase [Bdellovibrionota bacterium]